MNKEKFRKLITLLTFITSAITLACIAFNFALPLYISKKLNIHEASSIGIIGGADGPTSIYISNNSSSSPLLPYQNTLVFGILSIIGISYLLKTRKTHK